MRKKTVNHVADTIFWYIIYFLPIIAYLLYLMAEPGTAGYIIPLSDFLSESGFIHVVDNVVYSTLFALFGEGGILPLFSGTGIFIFFTYYIYVYLLHLVVDFILFIPLLCHKWMNSFTRGE